ncbi:MAG: hypothetical protein CVU44_06955 [Chloroflexi bacterium HGW-Chloroflexi-6]|nr:MAG: hypothetical protein CVU44_06955 [Chloroflexi bacterium HGW-Chloroflexi-6]
MTIPRLHILFEHGSDLIPFGSAQVRLLRPFCHPLLQSAFNATFGLEYFGARVDAVVVDRLWQPGINLLKAKSLVNDIRRAGAKFIYALDDNYFDLDISTLDWKPSDEMFQVVEYFITTADAVLVTTDNLKERLSAYNSMIFVVKNALDERLLPPPVEHHKPAGDPIIMGYMGTFTHDGDLKIILPAVQAIIKEYSGKVEFQILGVTHKADSRQILASLPATIIPLNPAIVPYDKFIPWFHANIHWDIGLCPLNDTPFTRSKSDIKHLDYGAAGIAGIYSRVPAYEDTVHHLQTGYLAGNTAEEWVDGFRVLIADSVLRNSIAHNARSYVLAERTIQSRYRDWVNVIESIL